MIIYSEWHDKMSKVDELRSYAEVLNLKFDMEEHEESDELFKITISTSDERLRKFHYYCYTQTCTMNHMDNTDWERGYIAGVNFGRSMAERFFSNYKEETK